MKGEVVLEVEKLCKEFKVRKKESIKAVDGVSFKAKKGEILGFLGPNGAGKTTTIKMICSLVKPSEGKVSIKGIDNQKKRNRALENISAVLEGNRNIYWKLTVKENMEFFATLKGRNPKELKDKIEHYIKFFDLESKKDELAGKLSRGMQQKLVLAVAMISQCEVIVLDEPTLGLDVKASYDIRELLKRMAKEENKAVIITTHDMNVVQDICDEIIIMNKGNIVAHDKTENLMRLFSVKKYEFTTEGLLSQNQKDGLNDIPHLEITERSKETEIVLNMEESSVFYKVMNILGSENTRIKSIENKELNFEKVFVEILGRSDTNAKEEIIA